MADDQQPEAAQAPQQEEQTVAAPAAGAKRSPSPGADQSKRQRVDKSGRAPHREREREPSVPRERAEGEERLPKRRAAILFGYCGIGYSGLQVNPGVKTIEGDIFDVLCRAGCVSKDNAVNPNKVGLQRAARTDRGVHAAGNLLNVKLIMNPPAVPSGDARELVQHLNSMLPPLIRIWSINRVQNAFNARNSCDSRLYQYLLPTYVFLPPKPGCPMWRTFKSWEGDEEMQGGAEAQERLKQVLYHPFWADALKEYEAKKGAAAKGEGEEGAPAEAEASAGADAEQGAAADAAELSTFKKDTHRKRQWRLADDEYGRSVLPRIRAIWQRYLGARNFHNYTIAKAFRDPSAKRIMKRLDISEPFIVQNTEYVSLTLHGQSFMLHQIRKMVGLLVLLARSPAPPDLVDCTYGPTKVHVPKAPALGLLLNSPVFGGYNDKVRRGNAALVRQRDEGKLSAEDFAAQTREEIEFESFKAEMEDFRMKHIYTTQYETEERDDEFAKWLNYLDAIVGRDFHFLNGRGVIPKYAALNSGGKGAGKGAAAKGKGEGEGAGGDAATAAVAGSIAKKEAEYQESDDESAVRGGKGEDMDG